MSFRYRFNWIFYNLTKGLLILLCRTYLRLRAFGRENVPRKGPFLIACNHASFLDPILAGTAAPRVLCYLARASLFRPPLKWLIERLFAYPLSRGESDPGAFKVVQRLLEQGHGVLLFPEGTRTRDGHLQHFRGGIGLLAHRCQVPVIPVYIRGSFECWPRTKKFPRPGRVEVHFGPPLLPEHYRDLPRNREGFEKIALELENRVKSLENREVL